LHQLQQAEPIPAWLAETIERVETFGGRATRIRQVLCRLASRQASFRPHLRPLPRLRLQIPVSQTCRQIVGTLHARCRASVALRDGRCIAQGMGT
jgi:hypothetical protein